MNVSETLLQWYDSEGRSLPWREEITPYKVWLSEIIMQQTRVSQGLPYYNKFLKALPTIQDFASAEQDQILHLWQGLGYYSRARNMHFAANQVLNDFEGEFPEEFTELKKLKGVGDYTAAAITSIAFEKVKAVVDGNVYRVLARLFNIDLPIDTTLGKKYFQKLADELISENRPGDYNQAIMDFGAMICTPKNPDCEKCPLAEKCIGYSKGTFASLPVKSKKVKVTNRYFEYFEISVGDEIAIEKRQGNDIWNGLYQLPLVEVNTVKEKGVENVKKLLNVEYLEVLKKEEKKHILSHQRLFATFYKISTTKKSDLMDDYEWVRRDRIHKYAFPKLISNYLLD